jgi:stress-induced morphogen
MQDVGHRGPRPHRPEPVVVGQDEPEVAAGVEALGDQLLVARLEDVKRDALRGEQYDAEREEPELRHAGSVRGVATMAHMSIERLDTLLREAFPDADEVSVEDRTGGGDHFQVVVTSTRFEGLPLIDQHRLVNDALAEPLRDGTIHELRIKTRGTT